MPSGLNYSLLSIIDRLYFSYLHKVLLNMVINAIQAMPDGGPLHALKGDVTEGFQMTLRQIRQQISRLVSYLRKFDIIMEVEA